MIYSDWVNFVGYYLPSQIVDPTLAQPFQTGVRYNYAIDRAIEYAELRMYRDPDFDFLAAYDTLTVPVTIGLRKQAIPTGMIVVSDLNIITPAGSNPNQAGSTRNQIVPVSEQFLNRVWPSQDYQARPQHYCRKDDATVLFGPVPDQTYSAEFYGTIQPQALSSSNVSTPLTTNFPDLFLAASMIFWVMFQKELGSVQALGPMEGVTWEQQYQNLKKGAAVQEARKKFQGPGWSAEAPTTVATPPRQ